MEIIGYGLAFIAGYSLGIGIMCLMALAKDDKNDKDL